MWTSHCITIEAEVPLPSQKVISALIRKVIRATLLEEGVESPCEVNVLITNDAGIREINREQREIDAPTDVLSFPMMELMPGELPDELWRDPGTGLIPLGDMVLNLDRMRDQAVDFGHSMKRELCYLVVHSVLHLLGYDHLDEAEDKAKMRTREEVILQSLEITREEA